MAECLFQTRSQSIAPETPGSRTVSALTSCTPTAPPIRVRHLDRSTMLEVSQSTLPIMFGFPTTAVWEPFRGLTPMEPRRQVSPFTGGGLASPYAIAIGNSDHAWLTSQNRLAEF